MRVNADGWTAFWAALSTGALLGHNLWLLASRPQSKEGDRLRLEINTSDHFPLSESAVQPERIADFSLISPSGHARLTEYRVEGDSLTAEVESPEAGMLVAALALHPRSIQLEAEKFLHYLNEEEAHHVIAARAADGVADADGREIYTKYAKAFLQTGKLHPEIFGRVAGQKLEIVPLNNPCRLRTGDRLLVQVLFDGAPVSGLRASTGCNRLSDGAYLAHARTDDDGKAEFEITAAGSWFVRTHLIRRHDTAATADWESFWSSMTFITADA